MAVSLAAIGHVVGAGGRRRYRWPAWSQAALIREYLLLGLRFDRIEEGYVDSFTGDPGNCVPSSPTNPRRDPAELARQAHRLLDALPQVPRDDAFDDTRAAYVDAHLRALACAGRKFGGETVGFVDEVRDYFDVTIAKGDQDRYREAHRQLDRVLGGEGSLADRMQADRRAEEIPPERLGECIEAFSSALRDRVRADYPLPDTEIITYEIVTDKPWSGFNYYHGDYRSTVAVNADLQPADVEPAALVAHESYPGHHTEHCRKEAGLVEGLGQLEQTIFLVNTPQCLMAEGLADLALYAAIGPDWGRWAQEHLRRPGSALRRRACPGGGRRDERACRRPSGRCADAARRAPRRRRRRRISAALAPGRRRPGPADACGSCRPRCGAPTPAPTSRATGCCAAGSTPGRRRRP